MLVDVLVIGAGPAGSLTAALVRKEHPERNVLVLERAEMPRYQIGESTIPSWRAVLERAGVLEKLEATHPMRKSGIVFEWGVDSTPWTVDFRDPQTGGATRSAFHLNRAEFDKVLADHAVSLGADLRTGARVTSVKQLPDSLSAHGAPRSEVQWEVDGVSHTAIADYVIDASGRARVLSKQFGVAALPNEGMNNFAVVGYWKGSGVAEFRFKTAENERWTYLATTDVGWLWHIPTGPDLASIGLVTEGDFVPSKVELETFYRDAIAACPSIAGLLEDATLTTHPRLNQQLTVHRNWSFRSERASAPGWFLVGDAAGFVDPVLSSGIMIASSAAGMAASALGTIWEDPDLDMDLLCQSYNEAYNEMLGGFHRLARVWYRQNSSRSGPYWEGRSDRLPDASSTVEADQDSFLAIAHGAFANPLDAGHRAADFDGVRPDVFIYRDHLFGRKREELVDAMSSGDLLRAHELVRGEFQSQWSQLSNRLLDASACTTKVRELYHTSGEATRWTRLHFVEVSHPDWTEDTVLLPTLPEIGCSVIDALDGTRTVIEIMAELGERVPESPAERGRFRESVVAQVLVLSARGWLSDVTGEADRPVPPTIPEPIVEALAPFATVDGISASVSLCAGGIVVRVAEGVAPLEVFSLKHRGSSLSFAVTQSCSVAYLQHTMSPETKRALERLVDHLKGWERAAPEEPDAFFERIRPFAGMALATTPVAGPPA